MHLSIPVLLAAAAACATIPWTSSLLPGAYAHLDQHQSPHPPPQLPLLLPGPPAPPPPPSHDDNAMKMKEGGDGSISATTYDELERFAKYASAAYQFVCPRPLGNTLVRTVSVVSSISSTRSFVWLAGLRREPPGAPVCFGGFF